MITRHELVLSPEYAYSKARGALLGLAVGDAMGDLGRRDEYRKRYGIITQLYDDASSTDDTEFALLTARTLLDCAGQLTTDALLASWRLHLLANGGVQARAGAPLYGAVANLERGILPPLSGRDNVAHYDDGAAMRIAPIGILCAGEPQRAAELAEIEAQVSHYADGIWAAQAVAASVAVAMVDGTTDEIVAEGLRYIPNDSWLGRSMERAMRICYEEETIENAWERLHTELWTPSHSASPEAVPQVYAIFRLTDGDFRRGLFWGCNFGRDADTIGAILGALSGARHGMEVIPPSWVNAARRPKGVCLKFAAQEDILDLATQLGDLLMSQNGRQ
jgi:ADP-ribosylglycohydrolase